MPLTVPSALNAVRTAILNGLFGDMRVGDRINDLINLHADLQAEATSREDGDSAINAELGKIVSGVVTWIGGQGQVSVPVGAAYDGKPAVAMIMKSDVDGTLTHITRVYWDGAGNLIIDGNGDPTSDTPVAYIVDGR